MQEYSYNLIDEPWIPVMQQGSSQVVEKSLSALFQEATTLGRIAGEVPIVTGALYRLLLAVLYSALRDHPRRDSWRRMWTEFWNQPEALSQEVLEYLEKHRERFDLFHPEHPFYQRPDDPLRDARWKIESIEQLPSTIELIPHLAYGPMLFDHHFNSKAKLWNPEDFSLSPAESIRWLLALMGYGLSGKVRGTTTTKRTSAADPPCGRAIFFFLEGDTLFETLMLNLFPYDHEWYPMGGDPQDDRPFWERDDPFEKADDEDGRQPYGYLDYLTWPSRRIRLYPRMKGERLVVERCVIAPGVRFWSPKKGGRRENACVLHDYHPLNHIRLSGGKSPTALTFQEGRALWRDSTSILHIEAAGGQGKHDSDRPPKALKWVRTLRRKAGHIWKQRWTLRLLAVGAASEAGQKKYYFYREEALPVPPRYLEDPAVLEQLKKAVRRAEDQGKDLSKATSALLCVYLLGVEKPAACPWGKLNEGAKKIIQKWEDEAARYYWPRLDRPFYDLMYGLAQAVEMNEGDPKAREEALGKVMKRWSETLGEAADSAYTAVADTLGNTVMALKAKSLTRPYLSRHRPSQKAKGEEEVVQDQVLRT